MRNPLGNFNFLSFFFFVMSLAKLNFILTLQLSVSPARNFISLIVKPDGAQSLGL